MQLNPNCVRDILIYLEHNLSIGINEFKPITKNVIAAELIGKYAREDIEYSLIQMHESNYIITDFNADISHNAFTLSVVLYITPKGHNVLSAISQEEKWSGKILPALKSLGSVSLSVVEAVAEGVTAATISQLLARQ